MSKIGEAFIVAVVAIVAILLLFLSAGLGAYYGSMAGLAVTDLLGIRDYYGEGFGAAAGLGAGIVGYIAFVGTLIGTSEDQRDSDEVAE